MTDGGGKERPATREPAHLPGQVGAVAGIWGVDGDSAGTGSIVAVDTLSQLWYTRFVVVQYPRHTAWVPKAILGQMIPGLPICPACLRNTGVPEKSHSGLPIARQHQGPHRTSYIPKTRSQRDSVPTGAIIVHSSVHGWKAFLGTNPFAESSLSRRRQPPISHEAPNSAPRRRNVRGGTIAPYCLFPRNAPYPLIASASKRDNAIEPAKTSMTTNPGPPRDLEERAHLPISGQRKGESGLVLRMVFHGAEMN